MKKDKTLENLYLHAENELLKHKLYSPKFFGMTLGNAEAINRAYYPVLRHIVEEGNKFADKMLMKASSIKSKKKAKASRENGKKGGRPKKLSAKGGIDN